MIGKPFRQPQGLAQIAGIQEPGFLVSEHHRGYSQIQPRCSRSSQSAFITAVMLSTIGLSGKSGIRAHAVHIAQHNHSPLCLERISQMFLSTQLLEIANDQLCRFTVRRQPSASKI
jgi:hypothetical protein